MSVLLSNTLHGQCPADKAFVLYSGQRLQSLQELADALHKMEAKQFVLHQKNDDISRWVDAVFSKSALAMVIQNAQNPVTIARIIEGGML